MGSPRLNLVGLVIYYINYSLPQYLKPHVKLTRMQMMPFRYLMLKRQLSLKNPKHTGLKNVNQWLISHRLRSMYVKQNDFGLRQRLLNIRHVKFSVGQNEIKRVI